MNPMEEGMIRAKQDENRARFERFERALRKLVNEHGMDSVAQTPDFILARMLLQAFATYASSALARDAFMRNMAAAANEAKAPGILVPEGVAREAEGKSAIIVEGQ